MANEKKDTKSYFNQALYLIVAHKAKDESKPYTVKRVIEMFEKNEIKAFEDAQLDQSTRSGIQSLLNGMIDPSRTSKYDLYLYEKKDGKFCKVTDRLLSLKDLDSKDLYLSEQANL